MEMGGQMRVEFAFTEPKPSERVGSYSLILAISEIGMGHVGVLFFLYLPCYQLIVIIQHRTRQTIEINLCGF